MSTNVKVGGGGILAGFFFALMLFAFISTILVLIGVVKIEGVSKTEDVPQFSVPMPPAAPVAPVVGVPAAPAAPAPTAAPAPVLVSSPATAAPAARQQTAPAGFSISVTTDIGTPQNVYFFKEGQAWDMGAVSSLPAGHYWVNAVTNGNWANGLGYKLMVNGVQVRKVSTAPNGHPALEFFILGDGTVNPLTPAAPAAARQQATPAPTPAASAPAPAATPAAPTPAATPAENQQGEVAGNTEEVPAVRGFFDVPAGFNGF